MSFSLGVFAQAGPYPSRPVRIVVPFAPGGATDYMARFIAQHLGKRSGQSFVVENRTGAGGIIAIESVVKAPPDGYTLLVASGSYAVNPAVMKLPFDPVNDLAPVVNMVAGPASFLVHPDLPVRNLAELVAYAKANPGKLVYASAGIGNTTHVAMEAFMAEAGIRMVHSPYRGMAPAVTAVGSGEAQVLLSDTASAMALVQAGKLRLIAVGGDKRLPQLPDIPSVVEAGFREVLAAPWQGMFAPRETPAAVVRWLNTQVNEILRDKDIVGQLDTRYFVALGGTAEDFGATVRSDVQKWQKVAREANIKVE
ncbi:MAG: Bug family tripartite tricarboxylate transporter substrate binding protein [Lautropia sp.]